MYTAQYFKDTATMLWKSYHHVLIGDAVVDDIRRWHGLGTAALTAAHYFSRTPDLCVPDKRKLEAAIAVIRSVVWLLRDSLRDIVPKTEVSSTAADSAATEGAGIAPVAESVNGEEFAIAEEAEEKADVSDVEAEVSSDVPSVTWDYIDSAFNKRIKTVVVTNRKHLDYLTFMRDVLNLFVEKIKDILEEEHAVKIDTVLAAEYSIVRDDEQLKDIKYFSTKSLPIFSTTDLKDWFVMNVQQPLSTDMEEFQEQDSGWSLQAILNLTIKINQLNPMRGSSYIPLPGYIARKKACINVVNNDRHCFKWALLSALHPNKENFNRVSSYTRYENELNFKDIEFPVNPRDVSKFEKQNSVSINIYFLKKQGKVFKVLPRHLTDHKKSKHVNLLLVESYYVDENEEVNHVDDYDIPPPRFHYVWIKDLSRLIGSQLANHGHKIHICDRCLHYFWSADKLAVHTLDCRKINQYKVVLPQKNNNILKFKNFKHKNRVPFVVYGDFECLLKPVNNDDNVRAYQRHEAYSVGFFVKCSFDNTRSVYKSYRQEGEEDEAPAVWFVKNLLDLALELEVICKNPKPMRMLTMREKAEFESAKSCHICRKPFTQEDMRVRDHCHLTGEYV